MGRVMPAAAYGVLVLLVGCGGGQDAVMDDASAVLIGRLFDSVSGEVIRDGVVVLSGGRVACSGSVGACAWPAGTPEYRHDDATILPGLIDLHTHMRGHFVRAYVPSGVTTVRDVNNRVTTIRAAKMMEGAPRIYASGPEVDGPESFLASRSETGGRVGDHPTEDLLPLIVETPGEAREAVRELADVGVDWLKLRESLDPQVFRTLAQTGRRVGIPATADLGLIITGGLNGPAVDIVDAVESGLTSVEHLSGLALAYERRGGDPFTEELDDRILDEIAERLVEADVYVVPTAAVLGQIGDPRFLDVDGLPGFEIFSPGLTPHWERLEEVAARLGPEIAADLRLWTSLFERVRAAGLIVGAGSDAPNGPFMLPGAGLHQELEALVLKGMSPVEALQAGTRNGAVILDQPDLGHLREGALADIVVVRGDPTVDVRRTRDVVSVWLAGTRMDLEELWRQVDIDVRRVEGPSWDPANP